MSNADVSSLQQYSYSLTFAKFAASTNRIRKYEHNSLDAIRARDAHDCDCRSWF